MLTVFFCLNWERDVMPRNTTFQMELFRTSILVQLQGKLCLLAVDPSSGGPARCPCCKKSQFFKDQGWTRCGSCLEFAALTAHLEQIEREWYPRN